MKYADIYELRDEGDVLSTGCTEPLAQMQDEFYKLFDYAEQELEQADITGVSQNVWQYTEDIWNNEVCKQRFFHKIEGLITIPSYKYVFKYLLLNYQVCINQEQLDDFFAYLESGLWSVDEELDECVLPVSAEESQRIVSDLLYQLKREYKKCGLDINRDWKEYLNKILYRFDLKFLNELALVLQMEYGYYRIFRKKVLGLGEINFYNRENIMMYLVLKYARDCSESDYVKAYHKLAQLYPKKKENLFIHSVKETTKEIGRRLTAYLENPDGGLKESYCKCLFTNEDANLAYMFQLVDSISRKVNKRSVERLFLEEWKKLEDHISRYEKKVIIEKVRLDKKNTVSVADYVGKQKIYGWLYGVNILQRAKNRNVERKDKEMYLLGNGSKEYFLNSKIFLETRIRDNTFSAFPADEQRQRNLLLTVGFLNFVLESERGGYLSEDYGERLVDFEIYIYRLFAPCGFMLPHSGNAYDAYLKLLLSCDAPVELFKYIWRLKTGSPE